MKTIQEIILNKLQKEKIEYFIDILDDKENLITEKNFNFIISLKENNDNKYKYMIFLSFNMLINNLFVAWLTNELSKIIDHKKYLLIIGEYFYVNEENRIYFGDKADKIFESESNENKAALKMFYKLDPSDCYKA